jgi:hypothetical protein
MPLPSIPASLTDNLAVMSAAKAVCTALAGVLLVLGVTVNPLLWAAIPPLVAAAYGLYRAVKASQTKAVAVALATEPPKT